MTRYTVRCVVTLAFAGLFLVACSANQKSIYRESRLGYGNEGTSVITDAKQRVIINTDIVNTSLPGQVTPRRVVCAEPSPDVAQSISSAIQSAIEVSRGDISGRAELGVSVAESIAQLGERLATIQLLRDQLFRACEAYANGAISATSYTILHSRLNKTMVTMLSSEMTAGAFGRALAHTLGSAGTGESAEGAKARQELKAAVDEYETAKTALEEATEENKAARQRDFEAKEKNLLNAARKVAAAKAAASSTVAGASAGRGVLGQISGDLLTHAAMQVASIHKQYINADSLDTLLDACITSVNFSKFNIEVFKQIGRLELSDDIRNIVLRQMGVTDETKFNTDCLENTFPEIREIAKKESEERQKILTIEARGQVARADAERLSEVHKLINLCAQAENRETAVCKKLDQVVRAEQN